MEKNSESDINHSAGERWKSSLQLMRIPFSVFLMPVFWFALIPVDLNWGKAILVFITLHLFVYPSSNGYNSYFDRDEKSIGGIKHPPKVTGELWYLILIFDFFSLLLATSVSLIFAAMIFVYILVSKAYSWDKVRLKKYPITGAAVVSVFQGAFTFMAVQIAVSDSMLFDRDDLILALVSSLFLLGSYPLTQIYQHEEDSKRGDKSLSMLLGIKGTFIFSAIAFAVAGALMTYVFALALYFNFVLVFLLAMLPVSIYFFKWYLDFKHGKEVINFDRTMKMNALSSLSLSAAFILMLLIK